MKQISPANGGQELFSSDFLGLTSEGSVSYRKFNELLKWEKEYVCSMQSEFRGCLILEPNELISGILEEVSFADTMAELERINEDEVNDKSEEVKLHSVEMYEFVAEFEEHLKEATTARVDTKYKTLAKEVKPIAVPLPGDSDKILERVSRERILRNPLKIGQSFTEETLAELQIGKDFLSKAEIVCFKEMIAKHGKAFAFQPSEIGCVDPSIVTPMVIFTVPHLPWNLRPIPVPRAHLSKLIDLLNEKIRMGILEPSSAPYSNRWFTVPKKNGSLRFIQDLQPINKVTIRNLGTGPVVDEFAEAFAGRSIYSMGDLYSGYDQFQLAQESRDLTTMKTPLGLVRTCTLPQGATNSVAHTMNGMNKVLLDFIPHTTMPFIDNLPIKGCEEGEKDEALDQRGCRKFVVDHISDCDAILTRLEEVHLTLSGSKTTFGAREVLIVGHLCSIEGRRSSPQKVDVIKKMKETMYIDN